MVLRVCVGGHFSSVIAAAAWIHQFSLYWHNVTVHWKPELSSVTPFEHMCGCTYICTLNCVETKAFYWTVHLSMGLFRIAYSTLLPSYTGKQKWKFCASEKSKSHLAKSDIELSRTYKNGPACHITHRTCLPYYCMSSIITLYQILFKIILFIFIFTNKSQISKIFCRTV